MRSASHRPRSWSSSETSSPSGVGAGRAAGVDQQQQGQQAAHLGFGGQQPVQDPGQPDGFVGEVGPQQLLARAGGVAFGEDQVEDAQHPRQAAGQLVAAGDPEDDPRVADLALGPHDPLRHRGLGHQERARHLGGGQPGQAPQRQRGLGLDRQRRVAAGEKQPQPLVGELLLDIAGALAGCRSNMLLCLDLHDRQAGGVGPVPPQPVDGLAPRGGEQPGHRCRRHPIYGPALQRRLDRLGSGVLGEVEITELAHQHGQQPAPLLPEHRLDGAGRPPAGHDRPNSWTGRTSTRHALAPGQRAAQSIAASRSGRSRM